MDANQAEAIRILRDKIAKNPNSPKVHKWKTIIANTERDAVKQAVREDLPKKVIKSQRARPHLTRQVKDTHDSILEVEEASIRTEYLHTALYPDDYAYRMPDELTQPTMLYRSLREFNLIANLDQTVNSGRFSFAVKPILGDISDRHKFQVGIVNNSAGWPSINDYTKDSTYVSNNLYTDPRVDPMIAPLTGAACQYYSTRYALGNIPSYATGGEYMNFVAPDDAAGQAIHGSLIHTVSPLPAAPLRFNVPWYTSEIVLHSNASGNNCFSVPTGTYYFSPMLVAGGSWSSTGSALQVALYAFTKDGQYAGAYISAPNSTDITDGVLSLQNVAPIFVHDGIVWNNNQGLITDERVVVRMFEEYCYVVAFSNIGLGIDNAFVGYSLVSTIDELLPTVSNNGSVIKIRPIALSCLVTCTLPEINAGGNIVAYSAPSADIDNYYYSLSSQMGPFQEWENLARTNKGKLLHDGNFKDGCYVWTQPWDKNDVLMRTPTQMNEYRYQGIIVSGQLNPSVTLSGPVNCGRIRIAIVYEYTTDNRLFNPESCIGSTADLDWVLGYLGVQQHATENPDHLQKIREIVRKGASLVNHSVPYIIKGADLASKVATLLL